MHCLVTVPVKGQVFANMETPLWEAACLLWVCTYSRTPFLHCLLVLHSRTLSSVLLLSPRTLPSDSVLGQVKPSLVVSSNSPNHSYFTEQSKIDP